MLLLLLLLLLCANRWRCYLLTEVTRSSLGPSQPHPCCLNSALLSFLFTLLISGLIKPTVWNSFSDLESPYLEIVGWLSFCCLWNIHKLLHFWKGRGGGTWVTDDPRSLPLCFLKVVGSWSWSHYRVRGDWTVLMWSSHHWNYVCNRSCPGKPSAPAWVTFHCLARPKGNGEESSLPKDEDLTLVPGIQSSSSLLCPQRPPKQHLLSPTEVTLLPRGQAV